MTPVTSQDRSTDGRSADFGDWVAQHQRSLLAFAELLVGDRHQAEDVVQTALARAFLRWSRLSEPDQDPLAYVRRIIVNENISVWRRWRRHERPIAEPPERTGAPDPTPDTTWELLQSLSVQQRTALTLRFYSDLSVADTASRMGCSAGSVKTHTSRGLAHLRRTLIDDDTAATEGRTTDDLASWLRARPEPLGPAGLARNSEHEARQRRRRQAAVGAVALAFLLVVPGLAWFRAGGTTEPGPAATVSQAPTDTPTFDTGNLPAGPSPKVDYLIGRQWHRADGSVVQLRGSAGLNVASRPIAYRGGVLTVRDVPDQQGDPSEYSLDGGPVTRLPGEGSGPMPGPNGSVLLPGPEALWVLDRDGAWNRNDQFSDKIHDRGFYHPLAGRSTVWTYREDPTWVERRSALAADAEVRKFPQWTSVVAASPVADLVGLTDGGGCYDVVDGTSAVIRWHSCTWQPRSFSADGRLAFATQGDDTASLGVIDLTTDEVRFKIENFSDSVDPADVYGVFDDQERVTFAGRTDADGWALVTCGEDGCVRSAPFSGQRYSPVEPNLP